MWSLHSWSSSRPNVFETFFPATRLAPFTTSLMLRNFKAKEGEAKIIRPFCYKAVNFSLLKACIKLKICVEKVKEKGPTFFAFNQFWWINVAWFLGMRIQSFLHPPLSWNSWKNPRNIWRAHIFRTEWRAILFNFCLLLLGLISLLKSLDFWVAKASLLTISVFAKPHWETHKRKSRA